MKRGNVGDENESTVYEAIKSITALKEKALTLYLTMPILGSSNSAANIDMMSKILTNGDTIF